MARQARGEYLDPNEVQIVHAISRCVRRAFLCGKDPYSGKSYEHRRQWIRDRLEFLASIFGIDCLTYTIMSNHLHLILRSRPDIVETWSDEEVARRWLAFGCDRKQQERAKGPSEPEINMITSDSNRVAELRLRLSDISWWMSKLNEKIARMSNREDQCKGHFWEGRYQAQLILDEAALLACAIYVDLNPIRAAMAKTPEDSKYTGAKDRIDDLAKSKATSVDSNQIRTTSNARTDATKESDWMCPLELNEHSTSPGPNPSPCGRRASLKGFLSISIESYLELLDWTGRQIRKKKRGSIPPHLSSILDRLGIETKGWCRLVHRFGRLFKRAAGKPDSIAREAARRNQGWLQAPGLQFLN